VRPQELAEAYLGALGRGDLDALAGLHIVYDTADVRPIFENETRRPSWPADQSGH
jgi:hypothetical protein